MTRKDFDSFSKIVVEELGDKYVLKQPGDPNYIYHFPQLQLKGTAIEPIQTTDRAQDGIFIDIFILENTPNNYFLRLAHGLISTFYLFVDSAVRQNECMAHISKYIGNNKEAINAVRKRAFIGKVFRFRSLERWLYVSDKWFGRVKNDKSKYVSCPTGRLHYFKETYLREQMCKYCECTFDGYRWSIPLGYDYYLKKRYGNNYMVIPSKEKREKHLYVKLDFGNSIEDK